MEDLIKNLQNLGYSDKQARVYTALLSLGKGSVQAIAHRSELKRPTVYVIIDELLEKGLVSRMVGSKKQLFLPTQPQAILEQSEKLYAEAKKCVPELMSLLDGQDQKKIKTLYFEGMRGIEKALWYKMEKLKNSSIVAFFGTTEYATKELVKVFHSWNKALHDHNITLNSIAPKDLSLHEFRKKDKQYGFKSKELSQKVYSSKVSVDITDQFVRIIFFKEKQVLIIESVEFATTLQQIFGLIWNM